jgi:hypothetical protein
MTNKSFKNSDNLSEHIIKKIEENSDYSQELFEQLQNDIKNLSPKEKEMI